MGMIGINCLQDLKARLITAGFEIKDSQGWYLDTIHGRWGMAHGVVYLNSQPIKNINDAPIIKKKITKKAVKKIKKGKK